MHDTCLARSSKIILYRQQRVNFFITSFKDTRLFPLISLLSLNFITSGSTASIKASGENGQP